MRVPDEGRRLIVATRVPCPKCEGKGYTFDHPEVDDPDDWEWCETCNVTGWIKPPTPADTERAARLWKEHH